jgi:hypothetical protein
MGSVKKKLTKTLRKITPKEIAPVLPLIAMAVPGLGPVAGNALLRFGLPQLLTAAASARTSGEINPLNQALAAFASYAATPDVAGASTTQEAAFMDRTAGEAAMKGIDPSAVGSPGAMAAQQAAQMPSVTAQQFAAARPEAFAKFLKDNPNVKNTFLEGINKSLVRPVGKSIQGIGQGEFNLRNIATVGSLGATPAGIDAAKQYQKEQEELAAYEAGLFDDYDQAVQDYIASFTGMQADPRRLYGLPSLFAAEGGRVAAQEGGPISSITDMINQNIDQMQDNLSQQIQGGFTTQETIVPVDSQAQLGAPATPTLQAQASPSNFDMAQRMMALTPQARRQMFMNARPVTIGNRQGNFGQLRPGISSLFNFAEGGMATAPGVPSGMQVDGRDGGFIPMGVKEKADDVPAMLSKNEFVMTADAVKAAGGGSVNKGAQRMYDLMNSLEAMV